MPIYYINTGTSPNAGNGDVLRTAFWKANLNFEYLNSISSATFTDITTDIIPAINNTYSLGSPVKQWKELFVSTGSIYLGNVKLSNNNGQLQIQNVVFTYNTVTNEITTETVTSGYAAPTVVPNFTITNTLTVSSMLSPALVLNTNSTVRFPLGMSVVSDSHDGILIKNDNLNTGITLTSQGASATDAWSGLLWSSTPTDVWGGTSTQSWMWVDASGGHISNYYDASLNLLPVTWKFDFNGNIIFPDGTTQDSGIPKALVGPLKRTLPDGARSFNNQNIYPGFTVTVATFLVNGVQPGWYLFGYGLFNTLIESVSTASGYTTISIADTNEMFEPAQRYSISPNLGVEVAIPSTGTGYLYYSGTETDTLIWDNTVLTTNGVQTFRTKTYEGQLVAVTTGVSFTPYDYTHAIFVTDVNDFSEVSVKNISNAGEASADFVCYNDQGDGTTFFIDMGINSSNYNSGDYPIFSPNSAYLYTGGENTSTSDLIIGTSTPGSNLKLFSGGIGTESIRFVIHGDTGNVIIGDDANSDDGVNKLQVAGSSTMTGSLSVSGTVRSTTFIGDLTGTASTASYATSFNTGTLVTTAVTAQGLTAGVTGTDVTVITQNTATTNTWTFGANGSTTLPAGGVIAEGGGLTGAIKLTPAGGANAYQALLIYPTAGGEGDHIHLTAGGGSTELYLGNDNQYVKLVNGGDIEVRAATADSTATAVWTFGTDGTALFPNQAIDGGTAPIELKSRSWSQLTYNNADMTAAPNKNHSTTFYVEGGDALLEIFRWDASSVLQHKQWTFSSDGTLTLPAGGVIADVGGLTGGVGIVGNLFVGGIVTATNMFIGPWAVSTSSGGITSPYSGIFTITNTTSSISTTTGALQVSGGVGVGGSMFVGGTVTATTFAGLASPGTTSTNSSSNVGYLGIPQNSKATGYTTLISDQGKHIYVTATATMTIDSNTNVPYPIGTTITFIAGSGATATIAITSDTMYLVGAGTTGSRTLAPFGMATAVKVAATTWFINGTGLT
jgi:hypothetical protein